MKNIIIITLFPDLFKPFVNHSIIKNAIEKKIVNFEIVNLRDYAFDKHKTVDDTPYGGGAGMILKIEIIDRALKDLKTKFKKDTKTILLSPKGEKFNQKIAYNLSLGSNIILICGHYGGIDERVNKLVDMQISLGDFVLTGGEIPAMAISDAMIRLIPKVINPASLKNETHSIKKYKQYPQYTKPEKYKTISKKFKTALTVPKALLSGNHQEIQKWRIMH